MVLESVVEVDNEWVPIHTLQNVALCLGLLDQLLVHRDRSFLEGLLRKQTTGAQLSDKKHSAVTAFAETLDGLKVVGAHLAHDIIAKHSGRLGQCIYAEVFIEIDFVSIHLRAVAVAGTIKSRHTGVA